MSTVARLAPAAAPSSPPAAAPVLVVGGFATPPVAFRPWAGALRAAGHDVTVATHRGGLACSESTYERLVRDASAATERTGAPVTVVAHSRGGQLGRVLAVRRPDLVGGLLTAGTPWRPGIDHLGRSTRRKLVLVGRAGSAGISGFFSLECLAATACCSAFWRDLMERWPGRAWYHALHAQDDRIVDARTVADPAARQTWVAGGHKAMLYSRAVRERIVALVQGRGEPAPAPLEVAPLAVDPVRVTFAARPERGADATPALAGGR